MVPARCFHPEPVTQSSRISGKEKQHAEPWTNNKRSRNIDCVALRNCTVSVSDLEGIEHTTIRTTPNVLRQYAFLNSPFVQIYLGSLFGGTRRMSSLKEKYPVLAARAKTDLKAARMLKLLATVENALSHRARTRMLMSKMRQSDLSPVLTRTNSR